MIFSEIFVLLNLMNGSQWSWWWLAFFIFTDAGSWHSVKEIAKGAKSRK